MQFFSIFLTLAALVTTTVLAQVPFFGAPQSMAKVTPGEQVLFSVFQGGVDDQFENVGIALGIAQCFSDCPGTNAPLGDVFYNGLFETTSVGSNQYQNFTVTIPSFYEAGTLVQVTASLFTLSGTAAFPNLQTIAIPLEVV